MKRIKHKQIKGYPLYLEGPPILRYEKLESLDCLVVNQLNYLFSKRLKEDIEERGFGNIRFTEVSVV